MEVEDRFISPGYIPSGPQASQMIRAWHYSTLNTIFPADSTYAKDWSSALSYLGKKKQKTDTSRDLRLTMESPRVYLPLQHPLEGRNNPQPSQPFIHWRVPSRYSDGEVSFTAEQKLVEEILADPKRIKSGRQHDITHTTHFAPPFGKFQPIRSEQQDHMDEILKKKEAMKNYFRTSFPRLASSAKTSYDKFQQQRKSHSAAEWWTKRNLKKQHQPMHQFMERSRKVKVDKFLSRSGNLAAQQAFQKWFETATETDRRAALHFLATVSGSKFRARESEPVSNSNNNSNNENDRLATVLGLMGRTRPQASPPDPKVLLSIDKNVRAMEKAAEKKHLRLYTPDTKSKQNHLHTWHQRPVYVHRARMNNVLSMYALPNAPVPKDFRIHPEWEF